MIYLATLPKKAYALIIHDEPYLEIVNLDKVFFKWYESKITQESRILGE